MTKLLCGIGAVLALIAIGFAAFGLLNLIGAVWCSLGIDDIVCGEEPYAVVGIMILLLLALGGMAVGGLSLGWYALFQKCSEFWEER